MDGIMLKNKHAFMYFICLLIWSIICIALIVFLDINLDFKTGLFSMSIVSILNAIDDLKEGKRE